MSHFNTAPVGPGPDEPVWYVSAGGQPAQGPISYNGLRNLAAAGHLFAGDYLWREGNAQWRPAGAVAPGLAPAPPVSYYRPPAAGEDPSLRWILPVGRSGMAIAAGYLGLISVLAVPGPIALIVSLVAISDLK